MSRRRITASPTARRSKRSAPISPAHRSASSLPARRSESVDHDFVSRAGHSRILLSAPYRRARERVEVRAGDGSADRGNRSRLTALHAFDDLHGDALAFGQIGNPGALQHGGMNEDVLAAVADGDDA